MDKHPIESIMATTMESIRDMVDVNTVVGEAIAAPDGSTVIPVSRVAFGFVAGGGEYKCAKQAAEAPSFAGGTGAVIDCVLDIDEMVRPMVAAGSPITDFLLD